TRAPVLITPGAWTGLAVTPGGDAWTIRTGVGDPRNGDPDLNRIAALYDTPADPPQDGIALPSDKPWSGFGGLGADYFTQPVVNKIERVGNKIVAGGVFSAVDLKPASNQALLNPTDGSPSGAQPDAVDGTITDYEPDGQGGFFVAGSFSNVGGAPHRGVA